ncbi:hypothetical protein [Alkalicoccus daliensis]|uniref:DUF4367 domain-containing protein n=1 Tax=Alkalicoccus daliensis TaxID=745820 RepID=A0A1H0D0L6_9BACI|nr:hypothetical protein [Alkalicoccus daliensis]SDN63401.1 hypothetical protein SAMN04488053_102291 [Alkalicoccus daliensis]
MKTLFSLFVLLLLISACGTESSSGNQELEQIINEELGIEPFIPEYEPYPIGIATINYHTEVENREAVQGEPSGAGVSYLTSKEEELDLDEDLKNEWEDKQRKKLIYGDFYQDPVVIDLTVYKGSVGSVNEAEVVEIEGHEVQYQYLEREHNDYVVYAMDFDSFGYMIIYHLVDGRTEEDATEFVSDIIVNNK